MVSLLFPDTGTRLVQHANGDFAALSVARLYADPAATVPAEIYADNVGAPGALITSSALTLDAYGQQPDYWGPAAGTDHLWIVVDGGPPVRVDAAYGPRITAATGTAGGAAQKAANLTDLTNAPAARTALGLGTAAVTNTGTGASNVILGNDARLTDTRTPTAHAASHATGGTDPVTLAISQVAGLAAALSGAGSLTATSTKTSAYTAVSGQFIPVDATAGAFTVALPATTTAAQVVAVKKLDTTVNKVTLQVAAGDVINASATSVSLSIPDEVFTLASTAPGLWFVVSGQKSLGSLDTRFQKNFGELVVTDPQWGLVPGQTDLYGPLTAAVASLGVAGGKIVVPPGNWTLSQPVNIKTGVHIEGAGKQATKITAVAGCFYWSVGVHEVHIEHLRLDATGGHILWSTNGSPFYQSQLKHLMLNQNDVNYSIAYHHGAGDWDRVVFEDCDMVRVAGSLNPAFDLVNSGNAANDNVWRDVRCDGQNSTSSPFFLLENTSTANYSWDNVWENVVGERNPAGLIRVLSARNLRIINVVDWDTTVNYVASHIHVGKSTASGATSSKNVLIANCGRRIGSGPTFAGTYDVNLPAGEVQYVDVFSPHNNGVSGSVNFSTADFVNVWGAGSLAWTGQPAGVGNHIGSGVDINGPIVVGGTRRSAGTVAPNGAVTGSVGDEYTNTTGGSGTTKWIKQSGTATTTGWTAFGVPSYTPRSVLTGGRLLLNGHPYPATVGTASWAKDTWRFAPISLYSQMPVNFLAVVATTNASVGTAAMIFALFSLDAYNRPGALATDYSGYGSIDLTAAPGGAEKLLTTTGLIIPAGDWYLGCAWTGTATGPPTMDAVTGNHPGVTSNAPGANNNAYSQAVTGASAPSPAVPAGAAASGIAVWAVLG